MYSYVPMTDISEEGKNSSTEADDTIKIPKVMVLDLSNKEDFQTFIKGERECEITFTSEYEYINYLTIRNYLDEVRKVFQHPIKCMKLLSFVDWYMPSSGAVNMSRIERCTHRITLPSTIIRRIFIEMIRSAEEMHGEGIEHCNINPETTLITSDGKILYSDFRHCIINKKDASITEQLGFGYSGFKLPELLLRLQNLLNSRRRENEEFNGVKEYKSPNRSADTFALGCSLYYLCFGVYPFTRRLINNERYALIKKHDFDEFWENVEEETKGYFGSSNCTPEEEKALKNLITKMFLVEPETAVTLADLEKDEWIANYKAAYDDEFKKEIQQLFRN